MAVAMGVVVHKSLLLTGGKCILLFLIGPTFWTKCPAFL